MGCDVKQQNPLDEMFETAKAMHWGIFCDFFDTCKAIGKCSEVCPQGGSGVLENVKQNDCSGCAE